MSPYGADSKCSLTGEEPKGNGAGRRRETESRRQRGRDDFKSDVPQRVRAERQTKEESAAKCGLPDETRRVRERDTGKRERWKREEETLSKCVPPQRAGSETRGAVLGSEYASGTEPSQAVSIEHIAREGESCHTAALSLSLPSSVSSAARSPLR